VDIQAAIDSGANVINVPAGVHLLDAGLVIPALNRDLPAGLEPGLIIQGEGAGSTIIYTNTPNLDLLTIARSNVSLRDLRLQGSLQSGAGRGIVISDPVNGRVLSNIRLADLYISATEREALYVPDGFPHQTLQPAYDRISVVCSYDRVTFAANAAGDLAYIGGWNTTHRFSQCSFTDFHGRALYLRGCESSSCRDCNFEAGDNTKPWVEGRGALYTLLDRCRFEDHRGGAVFTAHDKASQGWVERDLIQRRT